MILLLDVISFAAAQVMGEGPPGSVCRHGPQTAQMLLWSKRPWWWAIWEKALLQGRQVSVEKVNESEPSEDASW